jgi:phosphate starvation-inducible PhoH-like protein
MGRKKSVPTLSIEDELFISEKINGNKKIEYSNSSILNYKVELKCKNQKQKELYKLIKEKEIVFCCGIFGTGKSYVINATALELLKDTKTPYKKILIIVPTIEAGNMPLGYLKGDLDAKIQVYLDADLFTMEKILNYSGNYESGKKIIENLRSADIITAEPIGFLRGKTYDNTLCLISEAENFSMQEMLLILSRIGENSKMLISGDPKQLDRKDIIKNKEKCGLEYAIEKLCQLDEIGCIEFGKEDIVRNPLINKILENWND